MVMTELMILSVMLACGGGNDKATYICKQGIIKCIERNSSVMKQDTFEKCSLKYIEVKAK